MIPRQRLAGDFLDLCQVEIAKRHKNTVEM
jgi:hypothetical protein